MTTSRAGQGRLDRLAGDGNSEAGIDLASLFRDILNQIQDSAEAVPASALAKTAQAAVSNHARVEHWYGQFSDDPGGRGCSMTRSANLRRAGISLYAVG